MSEYDGLTKKEIKDFEKYLEDKEGKHIVLYNDDFNSFNHVIESLMKHCGHDAIRAEQCATIVHHRGKCSVKSGLPESLEPVKELLLQEKLNAKIE